MIVSGTADNSPPRGVNARQAIDAYLLVPENLNPTAETINPRRYALDKVATGTETELGTEGYVMRAVYPKLLSCVSPWRPGGTADGGFYE